jgi:hypothetical protein
MFTPPLGMMPSVTAERTIAPIHLGAVNPKLFRGGIILDGSKSRDPGNTPARDLRAGILLGKITASGKYAPSIIGLAGEAVESNETEIDVPAGVDTELVRRIGATGTFKLIGPPTAGGTVRALTITYSAIDLATHKVTITAPGVNEVQLATMNIASTAGNIQLAYTDPTTGGRRITGAVAWNATDATYLAAIQAALDLATGVANGIVVTAFPATDTDLKLVFTFSGTGFAAMPHPLIEVITYPTSTTQVAVTRTTAGVDGRFVTGSIIAPTDGSETPRGIFRGQDGYAVRMTDDLDADRDVSVPDLLIGADMMETANIINYPADASSKAWVKAQLRAVSPGWGFSDSL